MAPREPTRAQLSSKLSYQSKTPAFLLKLQNKINGVPNYDSDEGEGEYDEEFEHVGGGREPIPRRPREDTGAGSSAGGRPAIPERPADDPGSADEDDGDEKPQVVVLKAGKHLSEWEAENVRRAERGLPPLSDPNAPKESKEDKEDKIKESTASGSKSTGPKGLSFSSSSTATFGKSGKRKATSQLDELKFPLEAKKKVSAEGAGKGGKDGKGSKNPAKKAKKESKTLLSFGDDT